MDLRELISAERAEFVALLRSLTEEQWATPSLCEGWTVRDVAAHVAVDSVPLRTYVGASLSNRSADALNNHFVAKLSSAPTSELIERIESSTNKGWFSRWMRRVALPDNVVHQQDIRRPLGLPRQIDQEALRYTLDHPDPFAWPRRYTKGLRLVATDLDWAKGSGPEVRGTGEALALAMVGRRDVVAELDGPGAEEMRARILC